MRSSSWASRIQINAILQFIIPFLIGLGFVEPVVAANATWADVDRLTSEQKFQAALDKTEVILKDALAANDIRLTTEAQIRATQLRMGLHGYETAVRELKAATWTKDPAGRIFLNLYYAHALMRYQQMYSWEIASREKTVSTEKVDLKAWTLQQIGEEISRSFDEVMTSGVPLAQPMPAYFENYIEKNSYPREVRPVLRDMVVSMAVRHLANTQFWKPRESAEVYRLNIAKLANMSTAVRIDAANQIAHPLEKIASWLGEHRAFHLKAKRPEAALDTQYELLEILHRNVNEDADKLTLRRALEAVQQGNRSVSWWARGQALLADFIRSTNRTGRLIEARDEAAKGQKAFPKSIGGQMCAAIVFEIERPDYSMTSMSNDALSRRSLLLNYKNLRKMYFRAYPVNLEKMLVGKRNSGEIFDLRDLQEQIRMSTAKPLLEWSVDLQPTPDFAQHRKFITPKFTKAGAYAVISSSKPDFSGANDVVQAAKIVITDLVMATTPTRDGAIESRVLSGEKGTAITDADVSLYRFTWTSAPVLVETKKTSKDGVVVFKEPAKASSEYWNYFLVARRGGELTIERDRIYFNKTIDTTQVSSSFLYTDRSIYRPSQKLFWKVAAFSGNPTSGSYTSAGKGTSLTVQLVDSNSQTVDSKAVTANEFGTASGEFLIPPGRALGSWSLRIVGAHSNSVGFRVEEYKRPTFETKLRDASEPLRLNRVAKIEGDAKYYFGLPVSNGAVTWRVTRAEVAPLWGSWGRMDFSARRPAETVASGTSSVKSDGSFNFSFTPAADERKSRAKEGVSYTFSVEANVTDEGGETRSVTRAFRLGFVSVEAEIALAKNFFKAGEPVSISATLRSLDGKVKGGAAKFRVVRLKQPLQASVPSELPRDLSNESYGYGEISNEADLERFATPDDRKRARWETSFSWQQQTETWSDDEEISSGELQHAGTGVAEIKLKALPVGVYRLRYETQDDFGATYKQSVPFIVAASKVAVAIPLVLQAEKKSFEVGEVARFYLHSGLPNQLLQIETYRNGARTSIRSWVAGKDSDIFEIPMTANDRGGFTLSVSGVRDHQFLHDEVVVNVPWTDRSLKLEFSTFRDSLRPGSKETFRITAKDSAGKPLAAGTAEILAYMYDRSLDIFGAHVAPQVLGAYPNRTGSIPWNMTLAAQPATFWSGTFLGGPGMPTLREDSLKFQMNYGIGGPGRRGGMGIGFGGASDAAAPEAQSSFVLKSDVVDKEGITDKISARKLSNSVVGAVGAGMASAKSEAPVEIRSNFSETAFFVPHLIVGKDGIVSFEFTVPDSVTSWNVYAHALTKDIRGGSVLKATKSVKDLMVRTYAPRFVREGDEAEIRVTVNNASEAPMKGEVTFDIENPDDGKSAAALFGLKPRDLKVSFSVSKKGSSTKSFAIKAPPGLATYAFRVVAKSGAFSDGERKAFPVLPSRMHLVQSRFAALKNADKKVLEFKELASKEDVTRINEKMVVTIDAQLFYGVLQSLPYLVEFPYECVEQTLNRFLSTGIISSVFKQYPAIASMAKEMSGRKTQMEAFDTPDLNRRMSLEETPWLENAKGGRPTENPLVNILDQRIAKEERARSLSRLQKLQLPNGGFPWFEGGAPDVYMTTYVLMGFGRAMEYKVDVPKETIVKSWTYVRKWLDENIERMMREKCCSETISLIGYAVSLYPDSSWTGGLFDDAYRKRLADYSFLNWKMHSPLIKGYLALTLKRMNRVADAKLVWDSVMDSAKSDEQLGTYWAPEDRSWLWYNDTVETHAFSLKALMELDPKDKRIDGLAQWLFLNKKLNHWKSTRATAEAIYSLVHYLDRSGNLGVKEAISVTAGGEKNELVFDPVKYTGKKNQILIPGDKLSSKASSRVTIEKTTPGFAFASATWHFSTEKPPTEDQGDFFNVSRKYFRRELTVGATGNREWTLKPIVEGEKIHVGDQLEVQISLRTKHEAEYVHLRDPRAAGLEPENQVSGHHWDLGVSWFEEIRDSGANYFFSKLPVGEYSFKYRLRANMAGQFRVGPATVQSMYAPEFNAYSSGATLKIEPAAK